MSNLRAIGASIALVGICSLLASQSPASARPIGRWDFQSADYYCSITAQTETGNLILLTSQSGNSGMIVVPKMTIVQPKWQYPVKISYNGASDVELAGMGAMFAQSPSVMLKINAASIVADDRDGFSIRIKLRDLIVFDADLRGSSEAFAAFSACSRNFMANH